MLFDFSKALNTLDLDILLAIRESSGLEYDSNKIFQFVEKPFTIGETRHQNSTRKKP